MNPVIYISSGLFLLIILFVIIIYNNFIRKKNNIENNFSTISVFLKKRYDLIPNLVAMASNYMKHERETLTSLTTLRSKATNSDLTPNEKVELENTINRQINGVMVAVENYPDLKANIQFENLQRELSSVEDELQAARRSYNAAVVDFNNYLQMFPSNIIGNIQKYKAFTLFEISEVEKQNINVNDLFKQFKN